MRPSEILKERRDLVKEIAQQYSNKGLYNLRIFGSVADGTDTEESDIDFLVDTEDGVGLFALGGLYSALEDLLQCKIDLLSSRELPNRVKNRILMEAKPI